MMEIQEYLKDKIIAIDAKLDQLLPETPGPLLKLYQAARYAILGKGKRIRPMMTFAVCELFDFDDSAALIPACALEMIHAYSLIHDDLPCMDNDDFRRGQPTLHRVFPEGHALLTGDFLLTYAFETLSKAPLLSCEQKIQLVATLATRSGSRGMVGGQAMDIEAAESPLELSTVTQIHQWKTGALLTAAIEFGGIISGASSKQMGVLSAFGNDIGLAFQIIDDIQDVTLSIQKRGRSTPSDVMNKKTTYATLLGLDQSKQIAIQLFDSAIKKLNELNLNSTRLIQLAEYIIHREV